MTNGGVVTLTMVKSRPSALIVPTVHTVAMATTSTGRIIAASERKLT